MGGKIRAAHDGLNVGADAGLSGGFAGLSAEFTGLNTGFAGLSAELNAEFKEVVTNSGILVFVDTVLRPLKENSRGFLDISGNLMNIYLLKCLKNFRH